MRGVAGVLVLLAGTLPAAAGPRVSVRAHTEIILDPVHRAEGGVAIRGQVRERASGDPIAAGTVRVEVDGVAYEATLDADGRFDQFVPAEPGRRHAVAIDFGGEDRLDPSRVAIPELDVAKRPLTLTVIAPPRHARIDGPLEVTVQAQESFQPVALRAALHLGPVDAEPSELPRLLDVATDQGGIATVRIDPETLGPPGPKRVEVRFRGDDVFDAAQGQANVLVISTTTISFDVGDTSVPFEGRIRGAGRLVDDRGVPLAGQPVALSIDGAPPPRAQDAPADQPPPPAGATQQRVVDEAITAPDGTFTLEGRASELVPGAYRVQATFDAPAAYLEPDQSPPVLVMVAEKRPVPVGYSFAAFGATLASILAFVALRTRPWTRWLSRLRPEAARPVPDAAAGGPAAPPRTGLALARPGLAATLRRPHDLGFAGTVASAVDGVAIAGARVTATASGSPPRVAETDAGGGFALEDLPPGEHEASVSCDGFVTERFGVTIPHRGELRDARVDLLPVRERIFQLYRGAAEPLLPKAELWGVWTPRQIVDHVRQARPAQALGALTDYVEEKYFSGRTPLEDELPQAVERVREAEREARPEP